MVCYWSSWSVYREGDGQFKVSNIDVNLCTHVVYSFIGTTAQGDVVHLDSYVDLEYEGGCLAKLQNWRLNNPKLKLLIAVGGGAFGVTRFSQLAANPSAREAFARNFVAFLKKIKFDGLDVDWEYPAQYGGPAEDKANFILLLQTLRRAFDESGHILSVAVNTVKVTDERSYDIPGISKYVDFINLMTYDFHGIWDKRTGINAPMHASSADQTEVQRQLNVVAAVTYWLQAGAPKEKLILGIPTYGKSFTLTDPNQHGIGASAKSAGKPGKLTKDAGTLGFNEICLNNWPRTWSNQQQVPYAVKDDQWVGYDDVDSVKIKARYIKENNLGGAMFWSIDLDDFHGKCGHGRSPLIKSVRDLLHEKE